VSISDGGEGGGGGGEEGASAVGGNSGGCVGSDGGGGRKSEEEEVGLLATRFALSGAVDSSLDEDMDDPYKGSQSVGSQNDGSRPIVLSLDAAGAAGAAGAPRTGGVGGATHEGQSLPRPGHRRI
jgi:hypothetical protein